MRRRKPRSLMKVESDHLRFESGLPGCRPRAPSNPPPPPSCRFLRAVASLSPPKPSIVSARHPISQSPPTPHTPPAANPSISAAFPSLSQLTGRSGAGARGSSLPGAWKGRGRMQAATRSVSCIGAQPSVLIRCGGGALSASPGGLGGGGCRVRVVAVLRCCAQEKRPPRVRKSKEERREMVESFINRRVLCPSLRSHVDAHLAFGIIPRPQLSLIDTEMY
jgi:hypothetical protein